MKLSRLLCSAALALLLASQAPAIDSTFTFQGYLEEAGAPASGSFDVRFIMMDDDIGGGQVGPILEKMGVTVTDGVFVTDLDFGDAALSGSDRWIETAVKPAGTANYQVLSPRQQLRPTPYAFTAAVALSAPNSVTKSGDTMTGPLALPDNGLKVGTNQIVAANNRIGFGTENPAAFLHLNSNDGSNPPSLRFSQSDSLSADNYRFTMDSTSRLELAASTLNAGHQSGTVFRATGNSVLFPGKVNFGSTIDNNISTVNVLGGMSLKTRTVTSGNANALQDTDVVLFVNVANGTVIIPPSAATCKGRVYIIKRVGGGNAVIDPPGSETIDGAPSLNMNTANATRTIISDGTNWVVIGQ